MNLNHMFVWIFVFLGIFVILFAALPNDFYAFQTGVVAPNLQAKEVASYYSANNLTLYKNTWSFNINVGEMKYNQSGLPEGHRVEFHWQDMPFSPDYIEIRHAFPSWFFGLWLEYHFMFPTEEFRVKAGMPTWSPLIYKEHLLNLADGGNSSYFVVACDHVTQNFVVLPYNTSYTLSSSWDAGKLKVYSSYEIDFEAMKPSAWTLLVQILTFQSPNLGIPGFFGDVLNALLSLGIWACIILLVYAAVTSVIPFIKGWEGS